MPTHFHFAVVEVGGAWFILAVLPALAQLPIKNCEPFRTKVRPRYVVRELSPAGLFCGGGAPGMFFREGLTVGPSPHTRPCAPPRPAPSPATGAVAEAGLAFDPELIEVVGVSEPAICQVKVDEPQLSSIDAA
jgi:hypothetical protein